MKASVLFGVLCLTLSMGCNSGQFSGSSKQEGPDSADAEPAAETVDQGPDLGTTDPTVPDDQGTEDIATDPDTQTIDLPEKPDSAVTAGSFSVWAEPATPAPGQDYTIYIEVKLPSDTTAYDKTDLTGTVVGTDGYRQGIGTGSSGSSFPDHGPPWLKPWDPRETFNYSGDHAVLSLMVPGAEELVQDTIKIHSSLLNENQDLQLTFK